MALYFRLQVASLALPELKPGGHFMRTFIPAMAAMLLLSSILAFAVDAPQGGKDAATPNTTEVENQTQVQPDAQAPDDDDIQLTIMCKAVQVQVPTPYKIPKPHLLTDSWAMRA